MRAESEREITLMLEKGELIEIERGDGSSIRKLRDFFEPWVSKEPDNSGKLKPEKPETAERMRSKSKLGSSKTFYRLLERARTNGYLISEPKGFRISEKGLKAYVDLKKLCDDFAPFDLDTPRR